MIDKLLELATEPESVEHENDNDTNSVWYAWNDSQRPGKETGGTERSRHY